MLSLIQCATKFPDRIAIQDSGGQYSFQDLLDRSAQLAGLLLGDLADLAEARVGYMIAPGYDYVLVQWAIWRAGGIAVPICVSYPAPSIQYVLEDAQISQIVATESFDDLLEPLSTKLSIPKIILSKSIGKPVQLPDLSMERRALILYTSGTTGKPKGVVSTHAGLEAQIKALVEAWEWQKEDHILNILPLHHVHGIVNVLCCALWSGACCEFLPKFDPKAIFEVFQKGSVNLFMAVPTIYYKLIAYFDTLDPETQTEISARLQRFRLMVSGSAALPVSTLEKWQVISGHTLLERYGMTEMGMAISNSYREARIPGCIGMPLPGVEVRLVNEQEELVQAGDSGEIQVKGANVFKEYWNKPEATKAAFTPRGWFRTGDIAALQNGVYKILGRNSVDIIKSGAYKISALEIQEVLRKHPDIQDCAVVGIPDEEWGELVAASLIANPDQVNLDDLKTWLKERLPSYKIPRKYIFQNDLPRNVMGKVTKHKLKDLF